MSEETGTAGGVDRGSEGRREFMQKCGRFALVTPPVIALMLSADNRSHAGAISGVISDKKPKKDKPEKTIDKVKPKG